MSGAQIFVLYQEAIMGLTLIGIMWAWSQWA
jgi:hypothetical protein